MLEARLRDIIKQHDHVTGYCTTFSQGNTVQNLSQGLKIESGRNRASERKQDVFCFTLKGGQWGDTLLHPCIDALLAVEQAKPEKAVGPAEGEATEEELRLIKPREALRKVCVTWVATDVRPSETISQRWQVQQVFPSLPTVKECQGPLPVHCTDKEAGLPSEVTN